MSSTWKSPVWPSTWTVSLMSPSLSLKITHFIHPRSKPSSWLGLAGKVTVTGTPFPFSLLFLCCVDINRSRLFSEFSFLAVLSFTFSFLCLVLPFWGHCCARLWGSSVMDAGGSEGWERPSWGPGRECCAERVCVEEHVYKLICWLESLQKHRNSR